MANTFTIEDTAYEIFEKQYRHSREKLSVQKDTITGAVQNFESGIFRHTYNVTLLLTSTQLAHLEDLFAVTSPATNRCNIVDPEGFSWNRAGSGSGSGFANGTGGYFIGKLEFRPVSSLGYNSNNRFTVDVTLLVDAAGIKTK